jgi:two-component system, OmpR family, sensor kinase
MTAASVAARPQRAPIALQIVGMMIAGMLLSQLITVGIVLFVPPQSNPGYPAGTVAALLTGGTADAAVARRLVRTVEPAPPAFPPERARRDGFNEARVAALTHRSPADVRFYFRHDPEWLESLENIWRPPFRGPRRGPRRGPPPAGNGPRGFAGPPSAWLSDPEFPFFGRFVVSVKETDGQWVTVRPAAQPLIDEWQLRVLLWLGGSALLIAPAGYLFARRITAPLASFADAARRLGADPNSPPVVLDGPAEVGVAAVAFNDMQLRIRRYVADRMTMFSAISHDLRTPLARTRFKIEKAPDAVRDAIIPDLEQMDAMIGAVLKFMRDGAATAERQRLDLSSLLQTVVNDAVDAGGKASLDETLGLVIAADAQALNRLFANLVRNAVTYGGGAHVVARAEGGEAVIEVRDDGPGVAESELERVFDPFYRADRARNLDAGGVGLGLAIARSIARDHGGEIILELRHPGLGAIVRLPLA